MVSNVRGPDGRIHRQHLATRLQGIVGALQHSRKPVNVLEGIHGYDRVKPSEERRRKLLDVTVQNYVLIEDGVVDVLRDWYNPRMFVLFWPVLPVRWVDTIYGNPLAHAQGL